MLFQSPVMNYSFAMRWRWAQCGAAVEPSVALGLPPLGSTRLGGLCGGGTAGRVPRQPPAA